MSIPTVCPYCKKSNPLASGVGPSEGARARPGDISICIECAGVAIFTENGARLPDVNERAELDADPNVRRAVDGITRLRRHEWN